MNPTTLDSSFRSKSSQFAQGVYSSLKDLGAKISKFYLENCSSYVETAKEKAKANTWVIIPGVILGVALLFEYGGRKASKKSKQSKHKNSPQENKTEQATDLNPSKPDSSPKVGLYPFDASEEEKKEEEKTPTPVIQFTNEPIGEMPKKRKRKTSKKSFMENYYSEESRRERAFKKKEFAKDSLGIGNYATEDGSDVHDGYSTTLSERESIKPRKHSRGPQKKIVVSAGGYKSDNEKPRSYTSESDSDFVTRNQLQGQSPREARDTMFFQVLQNFASTRK